MTSRTEAPLPIDAVLPALRAALDRHACVVLQAPTGAGKTTRVPLAILDAPWLGSRRIIMLEPRRLAARAAARRMAASCGQTVGQLVGFRVRGETRVSRLTRVEVVTEGVLTRMLHADPTLDGVGAVIFDEFHERSVHADLGLALALRTQELVREDLRILVMSATLDGASVSRLMDDAPVVSSEGRLHAVDIRYLPGRAQRIESRAAGAVRHALAHDEGDVLVFLPGAPEIRRTAALLEDARLPRAVNLLRLQGDLSPREQDLAIARSPDGTRKVVLSTSIAETSLTIEGVAVVIDCGLSRVPRFSPRSGLTRLETVRVSRAGAAQRAGRAGRTGPGVCYRLWSADDDATLPERSRPEILEVDLAPLALDLAMAGVDDPRALRWLDAPPAPAFAAARELLRQLGALDGASRVTVHGSAMAAFAAHPRIAHMLLRARECGLGATAAAVASLLDERDILRRAGAAGDPDLRSRVSLLAGPADRDGVDRDALRRVTETMRRWRDQLEIPVSEIADPEDTGAALALAYPDRIARRRSGGGHRFLLRNGTGAELAEPGVLGQADWLAIAEIDGRSPNARIWLAAPMNEGDVTARFAHDVVTEERVVWNSRVGTVAATSRRMLGAITLGEHPVRQASDDAVALALLDAIDREEVSLRWSTSSIALRERVAFARALGADLPDFGEEALAKHRARWLLPRLSGLRSRADVEALDLVAILSALLSGEQHRMLERLAPTHVAVPTGSRIPVDYSDPAAPSIAVRLQEVFGLAQSPSVGDGAVPLTMELLSPAHRPVQVTRDLAGFWRTGYFAVRKDLRGRYPRHDWPDDPLAATPTRRARPRKDR